MKIRRIICLLIVLLLAVSLFGACGGSSSSDGSATAGSSNPVTIVKDGKSNAVIVRSEHASDKLTSAAQTLHKQLKAALDVSLGNRTDDSAREEGKPEIILGDTVREESKLAKDKLVASGAGRATDYIICVINGNIVIQGMNEEALLAAIDYYIANNIGLATIPGDYNHANIDTAEYATMNLNGVTKFYDYGIVRSHYETSYITQLELEKLSKALQNVVGYSFNILEDAYVAESDYEIVVGGSNRSGIETFTDLEHWQIRVSGTKIYLEGGSDYAIAMAATELTNDINAGNLTFTDGIYKSGNYSTTLSNYDTNKYYRYIWGDEFNGDAIDENRWYVVRAGEMSSTAYDGKMTYRSTDESTYVKDGKLYMVALRDDIGYYGGAIRTLDKMHYKYGYIEIKQLTPQGYGFWTALWLAGIDYTGNGNIQEGKGYPEIDVCENFGDSTLMRPTTHYWPTKLGEQAGGIWAEHHESPSQPPILERSAYCPDGRNFNDDFHTFGCMWTDKFVRFTCDGKAYYEVDITKSETDIEALNKNAYIIVSHAVMFENTPQFKTDPPTPPATDEEWANSNKYIVDYVHLWQLDSDHMTLF